MNKTFSGKILIFSAIILFQAAYVLAAKDPFHQKFQKVQKYSAKGSYKDGLRLNKRLLKKLENSGKKNDALYVQALFSAARLAMLSGYPQEYEKYFKAGKESLDNLDKNATIPYAYASAEAIDALLVTGNYYAAELYLNNISDILDGKELADKELSDRLRLRKTKILYHQGYYNKASTLAEEITESCLSEVRKIDTVLIGEDSLEVKLSSKEYKARKRNYVLSTILLAEIWSKNGYVKRADSLITRNEKYIKKNLGRNDYTMVENYYLKGLVLASLGKKYDSKKSFLRSRKIAAKSKGLRYARTSMDYLKIHEKVIQSYWAASLNGKARRERKTYEVRVRRYYGKNSHQYARLLIMDGEKALIKDDSKKAIEKFNAYLSKTASLPLYHSKVAVNDKLVELNLVNFQYEQVEKLLNANVGLKKEVCGEHSPSYHHSMLKLAGYYVDYGNNLKNTHAVFEHSLKTVYSQEVSHRNDGYINHVMNYVKLLELSDMYTEASSEISTLVDELSRYYGNQDFRHINALERKAALEIVLGNYSLAESHLNKNIEIYRKKYKSEDRLCYSRNLETVARLYLLQGRYAEAEKSLLKASKLTKKSENKKGYKTSTALEDLASLYLNTGKYHETEKILKESVQYKKSFFGEAHRTLINPYYLFSSLYFITGDFTEAEKYILNALSISEKVYGKESLNYYKNLSLQAKIYTSIGDYDKAEELYDNILKAYTSKFGSNHIFRAQILNELALVKVYNKKEAKEVEDLFTKALEIVKETMGDENPQYAHIQKNLAYFYLENSNYEASELLLDKANSIWIKKFGADNINTAEISMVKGTIAIKKKQYAVAKDHFTQSKNIYSKIFDRNHPSYVKALSKAGQMAFMTGDNKEAVRSLNEATSTYINYIQKYFPSLSEREKNKFWNTIKGDFEFYNFMAFSLREDYPQLTGNVYDYSLNTKSLLLNSSIKVKTRILESGDSTLIAKYEDWVLKKELFTYLLGLSPEQLKENQLDPKQLEKDIEGLEKELSEKSEVFASNYDSKKANSWKKIQEVLKDNEVAVEMIRYRGFAGEFVDDDVRYAALIVSPISKQNPELVIIENGKDLENKNLKYYRNCMKFKVEDEKSYEAYWVPIKSKLPTNALVYFSSDGVYNQVNLESLPDESGKFVIEENEIVLVNSTRSLIQNPAKQIKQKPLGESENIALYGNPLYYSKESGLKKISQLPGAETEVKNLDDLLVANGWAANTYLNEAATEESIKSLKNPKVFHIATHGFFLEEESNSKLTVLNESQLSQNPLLRSGLLLKNGGHLMSTDNIYQFNSEDGILTAFEAMNLNLDNTELVVLSACETGLGEVQAGEGVFGLQRAFLISGANSLIMTLFKVDDAVTTELMTLFYKNWIESGDKRKAFIKAKLQIKEKYEEPIYWGSFVMISK